MFSKRVRAAGFDVRFFPTPEIEHYDRNAFRDVIRHQYEFGRHHIALLQADGGLKSLCFKPGVGLLLFPAFLIALPLYVIAGCALNVWPWVKADRRHLIQWPAIQLMWMMKGIAFIEAV